MDIGASLQRARRIYKEDGLYSLIVSSLEFASRGFKLRDYQASRVDNQERYELIEHNLAEEDKNILDIGCSEGWFVHRFAQDGYFCLGIDRQTSRLHKAAKKYDDVEGMSLMSYTLTPKNINNLPEFDVILLLRVNTNWHKEYKQKKAEMMLRELGNKANKIFIGFPDFKLERDDFGDLDESSSIREYYDRYLIEVFDDEAEFDFIGETEYMGDSDYGMGDNALLYVVKCDDHIDTQSS